MLVTLIQAPEDISVKSFFKLKLLKECLWVLGVGFAFLFVGGRGLFCFLVTEAI